eukprot:CAMPEP_0184859522 /NCGR_PEP_ID=MMETSP0580-20130426/4495_1 /TAXON_ID=1118495 /ORGANISM="Dactyliosolen fragilissimus" /LENGTH=50 /DNA_ID=CAMNT_0027356171 /DNA_START=506 /DNA_END=658 /DNA_ORIENTATION=-
MVKHDEKLWRWQQNKQDLADILAPSQRVRRLLLFMDHLLPFLLKIMKIHA